MESHLLNRQIYVLLYPGEEQRKLSEFYSYCFISSFNYRGTYFHIICILNIYFFFPHYTW